MFKNEDHPDLTKIQVGLTCLYLNFSGVSVLLTYLFIYVVLLKPLQLRDAYYYASSNLYHV